MHVCIDRDGKPEIIGFTTLKLPEGMLPELMPVYCNFLEAHLFQIRIRCDPDEHLIQPVVMVDDPSQAELLPGWRPVNERTGPEPKSENSGRLAKK